MSAFSRHPLPGEAVQFWVPTQPTNPKYIENGHFWAAGTFAVALQPHHQPPTLRVKNALPPSLPKRPHPHDASLIIPNEDREKAVCMTHFPSAADHRSFPMTPLTSKPNSSIQTSPSDPASQ